MNHPELVHKHHRTSSNLHEQFVTHNLLSSLASPSLPYLLLPSLTQPTPQPTLSHLPTHSYSVFYCPPTSQPTLAYSILPHKTTAYLVLPCPTSAYSSLPHPTPAYTGFSCQPTPSYLILPQLTTSTWDGGVVQAHRTSSNLHEPHHHRDSKVCRCLNHPDLVPKHPTHLASSVMVRIV